jgi:hypothetical protein
MTYDVNSIDSNESSYMEDSDSDEDATISNALAFSSYNIVGRKTPDILMKTVGSRRTRTIGVFITQMFSF